MPVAVLMPAFNEEQAIGAVIAGLPPRVHDRAVRITVIDDGSTDATASIARGLGADVLSLPTNRGKGSALRLGLERVSPLDPQAIVWMDSDGQHPPDLLADITSPVMNDSADMVVGSRYLRSSRTRAPLNRRLIRWIVIRAIESSTGIHTTDPFSGYRCFSPRGVEALELTGDRYECELEAFFSVAEAGLVIQEIAIPRIYSEQSSKMGYHRGDLLGRIDVLRGYARTLAAHSSKKPIETTAPVNA